jgi:Ser-tRNA(Ala) deacylase AlaX
MMTELLYLRDAYARSFEATVTAVRDNGVVLDATLLYPTVGVTPGSRTGWLWDHATAVASKSMGPR